MNRPLAHRLRWITLMVVMAPMVLAAARTNDPGALIRVTMHSQVGVLLDEIPASMRDRAAQTIMGKPGAFWQARARMQVEYTQYRLSSRHYFYEGQHKFQLPLPPPERWTITLLMDRPLRVLVDGHDLVVVDYLFSSTLLSDLQSPALAEPALAPVGGTWDEPFILPVDPDLLFERTGYACVDESNYPPNSADAENARFLYNQECAVETPDTLSCHLTEPLPIESCVDALKKHVGYVETLLHFKRLAWDSTLADRVRWGQSRRADSADLSVVGEKLGNNRVVYRYIPADSCAVKEHCVSGSGWRRLLEFDASVRNVGRADLKIGHVQALAMSGMFEYSACHKHYHFRHYGTFLLDAEGEQAAHKQAFCLQSTSRDLNDEHTSLVSAYEGCQYQGITAGWGDDYMAGLECQWIDVTMLKASRPTLTFSVNPDKFMCEGQPVTDSEGRLTFEDTPFQLADGHTERRPVCEFSSDWDANNQASISLALPAEGSFVTQPCTRGQIGPVRDCGFKKQQDTLRCEPGQTVRLACTITGKNAQVLRVCERSAALGTGIACTYRQALGNVILADDQASQLSFTCPAARNAQEPGGEFALYTASVIDQDAAERVSCSIR
jgi:hypothetical protein